MKIYQTGDPCPCCGKPIRYTDPETLRLFSLAVHLVGLVDVSKLDTIQPLPRETEEEESTCTALQQITPATISKQR